MEIRRERPEHGVAVIRLNGSLDLPAAIAVRRALEETVAGGRPLVVVDLASVTDADSSGLGALVLGLRAARRAGGDLRLTGADEAMRRLLRLTTLDRVLRPYPTVEAAISLTA